MDDEQNDNEQIKEDAFRPDNGMFNPVSDGPKLPQDNDPPATAADDADQNDQQIPPDDPETDAALDTHQVYDEGVTDASEVNAENENPDNQPHPLDNQE